ncbi:hypothetical protein BGZ61DRAFT_359482 [Ilyonectria robusta]|uniref:uncharacterized protein n=1 Tax=Ilyonectria robusta TaxID=1079257 RepID=UPI001E8E942D|nr:uncharacterized protein BGZ61DRAFT_359482 [Ilyonectria robusta]KAH8679461.1 hypothetical protein BGZ61DRAFT_359482 [Ilyonectria robusta]
MSSANSQTATDTDTSNAGPSASKPTPLSIQESEQGNPPAHAARFACIDLCNFDCIRLANFTASEIADVNRVITENWHKGMRKSRRYGESREIQLYGLSWMGSASGHDESRLLVLHSLVFRKQVTVPPPCHWITISFDSYGKLKIINSPPPDLVAAVLRLFKLKIRQQEVTGDRLKIKLGTSAWASTGPHAVKTQLKLLSLLETLESCGFSLYATLGTENERDVLICYRRQGWIQGAPVMHR